MTDREKYFLLAKQKLLSRIGAISLEDEEMNSIRNDKLPVMERGNCVVLSEKVYQMLVAIQQDTYNKKLEYPFFLFGKREDSGRILYFDDYVIDTTGVESKSASFDKTDKLLNRLNNFVANSPRDGTCVIAHGHSHPPITNQYLNFSLGDMTSYMQWREENALFKSKEFFGCAVLLTGGNYNFLFFDGYDWYRYNDVFVQHKARDIEKLPCYGADRHFLQNVNNRNR